MKTYLIQVIYSTGRFQDFYVEARSAIAAQKKVARSCRDRWARVIIV
jgi:hypothetical protein